MSHLCQAGDASILQLLNQLYEHADSWHIIDLLQVPLLTINVHLEDCLRACPSPRQEHKEQSSGQSQRDQQTAECIVSPPAVLQLEQTGSDSPGRSSSHVADAVQCAALQPAVGQLLVPSQTSAATPDSASSPHFIPTVVLDHTALPAATSSLCHQQLSDTSQASSSVTTELSLIPHADLIGEYRIPDFVTAEEESDIVCMLDATAPKWKDSIFNGKHRYHQANTTILSCQQQAQQMLLACVSVADTIVSNTKELPVYCNWLPTLSSRLTG